MSTNVGHQMPRIRAVLQNRLSEKPIKGVRTRSQDLPISHRISSLLQSPTWSVRSLLPDHDAVTAPEDTITQTKLNHLLRLSALPPPKDKTEETKLMKTLQSQIHFVKEIQSVKTTGIEPLRAIRDESKAAIAEETVTIQELRPYFNREEQVGRNGRIRRRKDAKEPELEKAHSLDPFGMTADRSKQHGKYFVVRKQKRAAD